MITWTVAVRLDESREVVSGSTEELAAAVKRGADVRGYTTFDYEEHMAVPGSQEGLIQEMMSFSTVYWLEGGHVAGIQTTRYPANCSVGFGDLPSLSLFLNNENGRNGVARMYLDGRLGKTRPYEDVAGKYRVIDDWDAISPCPCENFTYDFNEYGWSVNDTWEEMLSHDSNGNVLSGSLKSLQDGFRSGRSLKVGVRNLCSHLSPKGDSPVEHEVFVELHSVYNHEDAGFLGGESMPLVRVAPGIPLAYRSGNWNYGWILPRTDGIVHHLVVDPHTREFITSESRNAIRWFAR